MNNILELCKIFKCNIGDLVNDNMIDLEDFKGFAENGINDGDKICIIKN